MLQYTYNRSFKLECGIVLPQLEIAYHTYGRLSAQGDNVIWVFHALTANSDAADWWSGLIGEGKLLDPRDYFIVCANMLGSCYGATSATSIHPTNNKRYGKDFPTITIRDMVASHQLLRKYLGIEKILLGLGGSMGGQQALEWGIMEPELFHNLCIIASNAVHSPWGIAFNETQRMALLSDSSLYNDSAEAGAKGLEAARAIAMLSYRNYETYHQTQSEKTNKLEDYRAASYQRYQGLKLSKRFHPLAYWTLTKAMDSHNAARKRGAIQEVLQQISIRTLCIGITSDLLFPIEEQQFLAENIPNAIFKAIDSAYGHDGFLIEYEKLAKLLADFLNPEREECIRNYELGIMK